MTTAVGQALERQDISLTSCSPVARTRSSGATAVRRRYSSYVGRGRSVSLTCRRGLSVAKRRVENTGEERGEVHGDGGTLPTPPTTQFRRRCCRLGANRCHLDTAAPQR